MITKSIINKMNKYPLIMIILAFMFTVPMNANAQLWKKEKTKDEIQQEKSDIQKMAKETLARLYKEQPKAKSVIAKSAGYGVFSNFGMKILFAGGGKGRGIVYDKINNNEIFMKMIELQAGLGMGIKKFRLIWVFEHHKDIVKFTSSGWELGAQATAAAKLNNDGEAYAGAMAVSPGIWLYQLTDDGLALELTGKGTKYFKDDDLN
jgi:lipid-binding SYLF domain-containing protein